MFLTKEVYRDVLVVQLTSSDWVSDWQSMDVMWSRENSQLSTSSEYCMRQSIGQQAHTILNTPREKHAHLPLTKCKPVTIHSSLLTSSSCDIVERPGTQCFARLIFQMTRISRDNGQAARRGTLAVDFSLEGSVVL